MLKVILLSIILSTLSLTAKATSFATFTDSVTKVRTDTVKSRSHGVDIDSLERAADRIELNSVTVTAEQSSMNAGTESFLVTNEMRKGTISASQMLNNVPGITVDLTTEKVNVGMERDVMILVNGQEVSRSFARSINPKRIRSVEIQRFPAGKFSNIPVLVNLVLKENYEGWDVGARAYGKEGLRTPHPAEGSVSAGIMYSFNKWDFTASADTDGAREYVATSFKRTILDKLMEETPAANWKNPTIRNHSKNTNLYGAAKYRLNKKNTLRFEINSKIGNFRGNECYDVSSVSPVATTTRIDDNRTKYTNDEYSAKIGYVGQYTQRSMFEADVTYDYYRVNDNSVYSINRVPEFDSYTKGTKNFVSVYAGGFQMFSDNVFLQYTNRATWRDYKNRYADNTDYFFTSDEIRNQTDLRLSWRPKNTLQFVAGGTLYAVKHTQRRDDEKSEKTHVNPVPYFMAYWKFHNDWWANAMYYSEISYPTLDHLSPNVVQTGDYMWSQGNPLLRSSILQYITGMLNYKGKLRLHYIWVANRHEQSKYYTVFDDGIMQSRINGNFHHWYLGLEGNFNLPYDMRCTFRAMHQRKSREYGGIKHKGTVWYLETELSYFNRKSGLSLVGNYHIGQENEPLLQGMTKNPIDILKLTAQKVFMKNHLSAALCVQLPVRIGHRLNTTNIDIPGFQSHYAIDNRMNTASVSLNIRVSFGNERARRLDNTLNLEREK